VIPFPVEVLPEPLAAFAREGARALTCDPAFIAVPLITAAASAIGNTRKIRLKRDWSEPAVVWAATVGESGTVKSPALELAIRPLWRRQQEILKAHAQARSEHKAALAEWKKLPKAQRDEQPEPPDPCKHPLCSDITIEALADRLQATPRGTLVTMDELGTWFGSFSRYNKTSPDVSHWLALFGARSLKVDRKTAEKTTLYVKHAAVCVTGTIQPATLGRNLVPEFFENGLAARLLVAMPPTQPKRWSDDEISDSTRRGVDDLFSRLFELRPDDGIDGDPEPRMIDLSPEALPMFRDFVNVHGEETNSLHGPVRAAWSKLEGYAARFALIFHCSRGATGEKDLDYIDGYDIENGIELARWFGEEAKRVYHRVQETDEQRDRRELIELIMRLGWRVTARDLMRHTRKYKTAEEAHAALKQLEDAAEGSFIELDTGGRRPQVFCLAQNPDREIAPPNSVDVDRSPENNGKHRLVSTSTPSGPRGIGIGRGGGR
jgi:hypothetical protein